MKFRVFLALVTTALSLTAIAAEPLRVAAVTAWSMPFGEFKNGQLTAGLVFDLASDIAKDLKTRSVFVSLPRNRVDQAALAGGFDLQCFTSPQWKDVPERYAWSTPIFDLTDVIFAHARVMPASSFTQLVHGSTFSAVLGYRYPILDAALAEGRLRRENVIDLDKVLLMVNAGRTPLGIANTLALDWYLRITPSHNLADWRLIIASTPIHCAVPKASRWPAEPLLDALARLKRSGRIEQIMSNYR